MGGVVRVRRGEGKRVERGMTSERVSSLFDQTLLFVSQLHSLSHLLHGTWIVMRLVGVTHDEWTYGFCE